MKYSAFNPGKPWLDTNGNRIQAHAGYMLIENGTFYWYGENKEKSNTEYEVWHWGVRLYSSQDLYNWTDEGIILMPELEDTTSPIYFNAKMDRPHILFNEKTGLYVMWLKIMSANSQGYAAMAVSETLKGPFRLVKSNYYPNGFEFGDFELVKDADRAYLIYERPHSELVITPLTEDYLAVEEDRYRCYFCNQKPPYTREAPATFSYKGKYYMITSGTTSKFPNPSETAVSDSFMGDWQVVGDPHIGDSGNTSFDSQISCIFEHPQKEGLFIAMADRWLVDLPADRPDMQKVFEGMFDETKPQIPCKFETLTRKDTSIADYVWLPVQFEEGVPVVRWYDRWRWEDFV